MIVLLAEVAFVLYRRLDSPLHNFGLYHVLVALHLFLAAHELEQGGPLDATTELAEEHADDEEEHGENEKHEEATRLVKESRLHVRCLLQLTRQARSKLRFIVSTRRTFLILKHSRFFET